MQGISHSSSEHGTTAMTQDAASISKLRHDEAASLAAAELARFLVLLKTLNKADWELPTACSLWNVRHIAAHQAGSLDGFTSFSKVRRLRSKAQVQPYLEQGMSILDATNQAQVELREDHTPAALIAEIEQQGPRAIAFRKRLPAILRAIRIPAPELGGMVPIGYLTDTIFTRDMWMHRLDICRATGHEFVQTADHDGRIVALVMRDLAKVLNPVLGSESVLYMLFGPAGGNWQIGKKPTSAATIAMDVLDFNLLASGRITADEIRSQSRITIQGDVSLGQRMLDHTSVPY